MQPLGFSTGALCKDAFAEAVATAMRLDLPAIELSALRRHELPLLEEFVSTANLSSFQYISLHAPTDYVVEQELDVADVLYRLSSESGWPVVVHPDCIHNFPAWRRFGSLLCIENMDKRKPVGRTVEELRLVFAELPDALLCFDIAHARQIDSSMTEAYRILEEFGTRLCQVHISEVSSRSRHDRISDSALEAFREVASLISKTTPVIIESPVSTTEAETEIRQAARVFDRLQRSSWRNRLSHEAFV